MIFDPRFKNPREISRTHVRKPFSRTHVRVPAYAPESVRVNFGTCPVVLYVHHHGAVASGFLGRLSDVLFMHRLGALVSRLAGAIRLPRVYRDIVCAIPVRSLVATSIGCLGALCSGWYRLHFSRDVRLMSFVFHLC